MKHWLIAVLVSGGFAAHGLKAQAPAPVPPVPPVPQVAPVPAPRAMPVVISNSNSGSFLGVGIKEIDSDRAKALKLKEEAGVEITRVDENSPAEKAGLHTGDVILEYNGQQVEGIEQFSRMVRETPAGREAKLGVFRNGANQTIMAKIGSRRPAPLAPFDLGNLSVRIPDIPHTFLGWRSSLLGVEAESLEGQLAEFFGVKEGVLVRSVIQGSAADKAGMKAGDVITRVDDSKVASSNDVTSRLRSNRGKPVPIVVLRDHKEVTVQVAVPGDDRSEERLYARPLGHPALL
jgi:serine protease Do